MLQETNPLVQKICAKIAIDGALFKKIEDLQSPEPKPNEAQNLDKNPQQTAHRWRAVDKIIYYKD